jgi:DinB superfamily
MQVSRKLQEIADKISSEREALLQSISGLTEDQLNYKPSSDGWSISDILHHLALSDEANAKFAAYILRQAEEKGIPSDPTPDNSVLDCMDHLREPLKTQVKAPDRVAPRSHLPAEESIARLKASREKLLGAFEQLSRYDVSQLSYPHPFLGDLNTYQWLVLAGGHESRHTAQIRKIREGFQI